MTLMHSLRTHTKGDCDLRPRPTGRSGLAHLVLLAHLRDVPKREDTEEPKFWVLVGGEPDQPKAALGSHGYSGRGRNALAQGLSFSPPDRAFCVVQPAALITPQMSARSARPSDQGQTAWRMSETAAAVETPHYDVNLSHVGYFVLNATGLERLIDATTPDGGTVRRRLS